MINNMVLLIYRYFRVGQLHIAAVISTGLYSEIKILIKINILKASLSLTNVSAQKAIS